MSQVFEWLVARWGALEDCSVPLSQSYELWTAQLDPEWRCSLGTNLPSPGSGCNVWGDISHWLAGSFVCW